MASEVAYHIGLVSRFQKTLSSGKSPCCLATMMIPQPIVQDIHVTYLTPNAVVFGS